MILFSVIVAEAQELDTLYHFDPDSIELCGYIGDCVNLGVVFRPDSTWQQYNVISLEIQHSGINIMVQEPISFHAFIDSFPGGVIDTLWVTEPDSTELWPDWITYQLSDRQALQELSGAISVTGIPLFTTLCDFSNPSGNS